MFFILTPYTLTVQTNLDLSTATSLVINYRGSYREAGSWIPTASGNNAVLNISDTLIDRRGTYRIQLEATIGGLLRRSSFASITFEKPLS